MMKLELKQKKLFTGERYFLFKDNTLNIVNKSLKKYKEYMIDVVALDPKIRGNFIFAIKSFALFIIFLNVSLILYLTPSLDFLVAENKTEFLATTIAIALISLVVFLILTQYERIFVARHTKVPLVRFYNGLPNKKEFKDFIETIQQQAQQRFDALALDLQKQRAGELKTIRRVHEQGGLSAAEYTAAKETLLKFSDK